MNFKVEILEEVYTNQKDLDELETYYIKKFNAVKNKNYYRFNMLGLIFIKV